VGRRLGWASLLLTLLASPAFAETVVLEAVLRGQVGCNLVFPCPEPAPDGGYGVGGSNPLDVFDVQDRNVFVFDLSSVGDPIVAAKLVLVNPPGGFVSPQKRETYVVNAVSAPVDDAGVVSQDIGTGADVGSIEVDLASPSTLEIPLAAQLLHRLERSGLVVLGGRITTLKNKGGLERLFGGTGPGTGVPAPQLVLTTDPLGTPDGPAILHVDAAVRDDSGDGSEAAPFRTLSVALDLAAPGDVVEAEAGVYREGVLLRSEVTLRGASPAATIDLTELEGAAPRSVICAEDAVLENLHIVDRSGSADSFPVDCGASTEIADNVFESANLAIRQHGGSGWIHHNEIRGVVAIESASALVEENEIEAAEGATEAIDVSGDGSGEVTIRRNRVRGLLAAEGADIELTVASNVFLPPPDPEADGAGGAFLGALDEVRILHNTFHETDGVRVLAGNTARIASNVIVDGTAGIVFGDEVSAVIRHNDVFGNRAGVMGASTNYVNLADRTGLSGNVSVDPQFVDAFFEDFRLRPASPAVDAGSELEDDLAGDADHDGDARVVDGDDDDDDVVDLGAQELQPDEELPLPALPIAVDVLPGRSPNELKLAKVQKGAGKLAVAILSDGALDAPAEVDVATLLLEREPALRCSDKDVDRDGSDDLLCSFPLRAVDASNWPIFVPPACVRGETFAGRKLLGCDEVELIP
jgi:hypothetical protein